ncbi:MAG TPA: hypothetical protein VMH04_07535 [Candidatus Solibacter sp.]|nr:hypothetical protein [Candidatus Solibacter sp.]
MTPLKFRSSPCYFFAALLLLQFNLAAHAQAPSTARNESVDVTTPPVTFNFVTTPDILSVNSLSADSENDIWATSVINSVSLHFDGNTWKAIPMAKTSKIAKVEVISTTNVWAVGQQTNAKLSQIQHFNGTTWTVVSSPHVAAGETLNSLKAVSASNIFAVGATRDNLNNQVPFVEHFDGSAWKVVQVPHVSGGELFDIAVVSSSDIWAVGATSSAAVTLHFNGQQWRRFAAPVAALFGVTAISTNNVWAVGDTLPTGAIVEHWDGNSWKLVTSPNTGNVSNLVSVSAISATDIWATGCSLCGDVGGNLPALVEHWDGTSWTVNPAPTEFAGVAGQSVLTFPNGDIFVGGVAQTQTGVTSVIMKGVEGQ